MKNIDLTFITNEGCMANCLCLKEIYNCRFATAEKSYTQKICENIIMPNKRQAYCPTAQRVEDCDCGGGRIRPQIVVDAVYGVII